MRVDSPQTPFDVDALRAAEFGALGDGAYLNAASFTPLPARAMAAVDAFHARRARAYDLDDEQLVAVLADARTAAAGLIGADTDEIALGWNTSFGINLAALALPMPAGGVIVVSDREFPANVYPWMACPGATLDLVPTTPSGCPDEERLFERLDRGDVAVFALSSVQFSTGYHADLPRFGRFCRERGIHFVVDGIQSLGQLPLDVEEACIDVLATGGQKWLCSPFGTGFAYVRRELLPAMEPTIVGWTGMNASADVGSLLAYRWGFRADARRFEVSTLPFQDFAGFAASVGLLREVGVDAIAGHIASLLSPVIAWLQEEADVTIVSSLDPVHRSGILAFRTPAIDRTFARLGEAGVTCSLREGAIRISPHLYSTEADTGRVLEVLEHSRNSGWQ